VARPTGTTRPNTPGTLPIGTAATQNQRQDRENRQGQAEQGRQDRQGNAQNQGQNRDNQREGQAQPTQQEHQQGSAQNQGQNRDNQRQGQAQQGQGQAGRDEQAGSVRLTAEQRTKVRQEIFSGNNVPRIDNATFSVRVGTVVPTDVRIAVVPEALIEIHPEWRGDQYFVVQDDIVIVDRDRHIIAVMPVGSSAAQREGSSQRTSSDLNESTIREVQMKLNQKGFDVGPADGIMGPRTKDALAQFQRQEGLQVSGDIDNATADALGAAPSTTGQGSPSQSRNR
jgi:Putative peptidoglycan binding domain/Protein of unknown function (DUF1236)